MIVCLLMVGVEELCTKYLFSGNTVADFFISAIIISFVFSAIGILCDSVFVPNMETVVKR